MLNWLLVLVALLFFGFFWVISAPEVADCATADGCGEVKVVEGWPPVTINGHEGVILPVDAAPDLVLPGFGAPEAYWVPAEAELQEAEDAIARNAARTPGLGEEMLEGQRQYAGFIDGGERKIYINSFCAELDGWRTNVIFVLDGGVCFWQAVYNVDTGEVERISVNGEA